jgi:phosphatidylglycerophosphate synthase
MASVLLTLWHDGRVPAWQLPLVGFRDLAVAVGSAWQVVRHGWGAVADLPPSRLGKLTTAAQFVFLLTVLYHHGSAPFACAAATALSLSAGIGYLTRPPARPLQNRVSCDCSATTSTRGSAGATGSTGSTGSSR